MSLLVAFDNIDINGNRFLLEYLSNEFPVITLDRASKVRDFPNGKCLFTTSISIAQEVGGSIPTILYLNDPYESFSSRKDNIAGWRQGLVTFKNMDSIFVVSSQLSANFLKTYRTTCKVQYPHVSEKERRISNYILYNKTPPYLDEMFEFSLNESYMVYSDEDDFKEAKIYIHIPDPGEQWHINVLLAHSYGVPCITYQQGCFSEFCTTGDKVLSPGCSMKIWMENFKVALRDQEINSKIVYDMSKRFHIMSEIRQRIKNILINNGFAKPQPSFAQAQEQAASVSALKRLQGRKSEERPTFTQRIIRPQTRRNEYVNLSQFLNNNESIYAGVGGIGDAVLILALAHGDSKSKIVFGANGGVRDTIRQLFETFNVECLLVNNFNGSIEGLMAWNSILDHPNCKGSAHLPKDLNYGEWGSNSKLYLDKTIKRMPLIKILGKLINPRATKKVIGLCPRGSDHHSTWKQRYLSKDEYRQLVKKLLSEEATVIVFGSAEDLDYYDVYQDNNVIFMNSDFAISYPAPRYPITIRHMLTAVHACDLIISVDTWLKTYAALAGIPCKVIMNRYFGKSTLEYADPSDKIFLDPLAWGFELVPLESLF
jgi:hypothetical protein